MLNPKNGLKNVDKNECNNNVLVYNSNNTRQLLTKEEFQRILNAQGNSNDCNVVVNNPISVDVYRDRTFVNGREVPQVFYLMSDAEICMSKGDLRDTPLMRVDASEFRGYAYEMQPQMNAKGNVPVAVFDLYFSQQSNNYTPSGTQVNVYGANQGPGQGSMSGGSRQNAGGGGSHVSPHSSYHSRTTDRKGSNLGLQDPNAYRGSPEMASTKASSAHRKSFDSRRSANGAQNATPNYYADPKNVAGYDQPDIKQGTTRTVKTKDILEDLANMSVIPQANARITYLKDGNVVGTKIMSVLIDESDGRMAVGPFPSVPS